MRYLIICMKHSRYCHSLQIVIGNSGVLQGMSSGKGFVDMSTIDVDTVKEIAEVSY